MESEEMMHPEKLESNAKWSKDVEHLLPKLTSSIANGVRTCNIEQEAENKLFRHPPSYQHNGISNRFKIPLTHPSIRESSSNKNHITGSDVHEVFVIHHDRAHKQVIRSFIGGLSHCYNNLLMGIWGNASLIAMILDEDHPVQPHLNKIEALIQDGSNLIHLLFGYIVERRSAAKRLRFKQLVQEIKRYHQISGNDIDFPIFKTGIIRLSKISDKVQLAACISPVIKQLLTLVQEKRLAMEPNCYDLATARTYLDKMDELLGLGFMMIQDLDFYAGSMPVKRKNVSLKSIIRQQASDVRVKHTGLDITQDISANLPYIKADPSQIAYALAHLANNAVDAIAGDGKIHFKVNTLNSENPHERCGVHSINNYLVMTVSDNGKGISTATQAQIFDPFFTGYKGQGKAGLGLAAAAGIIKSHGGYIQVRSKLEEGCTFKVYLPISKGLLS